MSVCIFFILGYLVFNYHNIHAQIINCFSNTSVWIIVKMQKYSSFLIIDVAHDVNQPASYNIFPFSSINCCGYATGISTKKNILIVHYCSSYCVKPVANRKYYNEWLLCSLVFYWSVDYLVNKQLAVVHLNLHCCLDIIKHSAVAVKSFIMEMKWNSIIDECQVMTHSFNFFASVCFASTPTAVYPCSDLFISKTPAQPKHRWWHGAPIKYSVCKWSRAGRREEEGEVREKTIRKEMRG